MDNMVSDMLNTLKWAYGCTSRLPSTTATACSRNTAAAGSDGMIGVGRGHHETEAAEADEGDAVPYWTAADVHFWSSALAGKEGRVVGAVAVAAMTATEPVCKASQGVDADKEDTRIQHLPLLSGPFSGSSVPLPASLPSFSPAGGHSDS